MISADRQAHDIRPISEVVTGHQTALHGDEVPNILEADADVASGFDRAKVRTLIENASTLGVIDKAVK